MSQEITQGDLFRDGTADAASAAPPPEATTGLDLAPMTQSDFMALVERYHPDELHGHEPDRLWRSAQNAASIGRHAFLDLNGTEVGADLAHLEPLPPEQVEPDMVDLRAVLYGMRVAERGLRPLQLSKPLWDIIADHYNGQNAAQGLPETADVLDWDDNIHQKFKSKDNDVRASGAEELRALYHAYYQDPTAKL